MKKIEDRDLWPFSLELTCALAMPVMFWLGWIVGRL